MSNQLERLMTYVGELADILGQQPGEELLDCARRVRAESAKAEAQPPLDELARRIRDLAPAQREWLLEPYRRSLREALMATEQLRKAEAQPAGTGLLEELRKHQDLVEALQWLPMETVVNFADLDDFLEELRDMGWRPMRECKHVFRDSDRCVYCVFSPDDESPPEHDR